MAHEIKYMRKRIAIVAAVIIILILSVIGFMALVPYGGGGGFTGVIYKTCDCAGIGWEKYVGDMVDFYCIGILKNCKCYNGQKAKEYGEAVRNGSLTVTNYWEDLLNYAYDPC